MLKNMFIRCTLLFLLSLTVYIKAKVNCTAPWENIFGDSCHLLMKKLETWNEAKISCLAIGSHLIVVDNEEKQKAFEIWSASSRKLHQSQHNFWAGGTDFASETSWYWDPTGRPFIYNHWQNGYPKKTTRTNCLIIGINFHYFWHDIPCDTVLYFICGKKQ